MNLGLILMTVAILQFTIIPPIVDLNRSHAANPDWLPHARFHVVVQVLTTSGFGLACLWLLWSERAEQELAVCIATMLASVALGSFFLGALTVRSYGGAVNAGQGPAAIRIRQIDGNVANFAVAAALLLTGRLLALA